MSAEDEPTNKPTVGIAVNRSATYMQFNRESDGGQVHEVERTWQVNARLLVDIGDGGQIVGIESLDGNVTFTDLHTILSKVYLRNVTK